MTFIFRVPPGISVSILLYGQDPKIAVQSFDANPDISLKITKATLHVPVGVLSSNAYSKYEMELQSRNAKLRLRRWIVKVQNIVASTTDFDSKEIRLGYTSSYMKNVDSNYFFRQHYVWYV